MRTTILLTLALFACSGDKPASTATTALPVATGTGTGATGTGTGATGTGTGATGTGTGATGTGTGATGTGTGATGTGTGATGTGTGATGTGTGTTGTPGSTLTAGGWWFGNCYGPCQGELQVPNASATATITDWFMVQHMNNTGTLTAAGIAEKDAIAAALVGTQLQAIYGCPDCADGGAAWVDLDRQGQQSNHVYEPYNVPADLVRADTFHNRVFQALRLCVADAWVNPDPDLRRILERSSTQPVPATC